MNPISILDHSEQPSFTRSEASSYPKTNNQTPQFLFCLSQNQQKNNGGKWDEREKEIWYRRSQMKQNSKREREREITRICEIRQEKLQVRAM